MNYDRPELLERLASGYVLGTMGTHARRRFEKLVRQLPAAHQAVEAWSNRLHLLSVPEFKLEPSPAVWQAIERRMDRPGPGAAARGARWSWLKPVAGFAFGALLMWSLGVMHPTLVTTVEDVARIEQTLPQSYIGLLNDDRGVPVVLASSLRHGKRLTVKFLRELPPTDGKQRVLWAIPQDGAPFLLGVLPGTKGQGELAMADTSERLLANVTRLAVSEEPLGPPPLSPSAAPILSGACVKLWRPAAPAAQPAAKP